MVATIGITFLGTASAQPSSTRNHSSLALRLDGDVWLFDCGEATQHQVQKSNVKMGKIQKIFITHTHGDHIFGLLPILASRLNGAGGMAEGADDPRAQNLVSNMATAEPIEIYGPYGTRAYVRTGLKYTHTHLGSPYVVHELRTAHDPPEDSCTLPLDPAEQPGRDLAAGADGTWRDVFASDALAVSAAPIWHSVPCVGYAVAERPVPGKMVPALYVPHLKRTGTPMSVLRQLQLGERVQLADGTVLEGPARRPGRKVVILGDTYDPSPIAALAEDADLLVHEATNAHLPGIDPDTKATDTYEIVEERAKSRGHSTPQMAGAFAKRIGAKRLVLNHFSARYAGNDDVNEEARNVMVAIRHLAEEQYGDGREVLCARDLMTIDVEPRK
ncbi:ribonuclease Z [Phanerochaete sordida]|uniref:Ribonuclease Z n=1 Tax=Phanerochaete sordida TaxID=48140 RepID=A0A9P3FWX1_9APHY|nr:ribonuclease Z [Phanerochaete sordida]